jgi:hypothetical protein
MSSQLGSTSTSYWWVLQRVEHVSIYESFEKGYLRGHAKTMRLVTCCYSIDYAKNQERGLNKNMCKIIKEKNEGQMEIEWLRIR